MLPPVEVPEVVLLPVPEVFEEELASAESRADWDPQAERTITLNTKEAIFKFFILPIDKARVMPRAGHFHSFGNCCKQASFYSAMKVVEPRCLPSRHTPA